MLRVLDVLCRVIAPILAFTAEEVFAYLHPEESSVHAAAWPAPEEALIDEQLEKEWSALARLREQVLKAIEEKRSAGIVGSSLEAEVVLFAPEEETARFLKEKAAVLADVFIVSGVRIEQTMPPDDAQPVIGEGLPKSALRVQKARGSKCPRCWHWTESVGTDPVHADVCDRCARVLTESTKGDGNETGNAHTRKKD